MEFMPHKTNITGDTYSSTMVVLRENIKQKRREELSAGVLLLHDNAPAHKSHTSRTPIRKFSFVELNHHRTVQTWLPVTTFSSVTLKKCLRGRRFPIGNAVKEDVTGYFDTQNVSFFLRVFDHWWRSGLMPGFSNVRYRFYTDIDRLTDVLALHERKIAHWFDKEYANLEDGDRRDIYSVS